MPTTIEAPTIIQDIKTAFGDVDFIEQSTKDGVPTFWIPAGKIRDVLRYLKTSAFQPYKMLYDMTAIDERFRTNRQGQPASDFTVVYHLLSFERNADVRLKVALRGDMPSLPSIADLWANANWY